MSFPPGVGVPFEQSGKVLEHIRHQGVSCWQELQQVCAKAELYLGTLERLRGRGSGVHMMFAGFENSGSSYFIENFQLLRLGASFSEQQLGEPYRPSQLQNYYIYGTLLRILMQSTMSNDNFAGSPFEKSHVGHTSGTTAWPVIETAKLKDLAQRLGQARAGMNAKAVVEFLSKTFGPISPAGSKRIYAAFGQRAPTRDRTATKRPGA